MEQTYRKGDFIWFTDDTKEVYPGKIIDIENDKYTVEICASKKNCSGKELEIITGKRTQLKLRVLGL